MATTDIAPTIAASGTTLAQALEDARLLRSSGRLAEAETAFRRVLAMAPGHAEALAELAAILRDSGSAAAAAAERAAGEAAIDQAAGMAASLLDTPLQSRAPALLKQAVQTYPSLASGPLAQVELYRRLGDLDAARDAARRCLALDPGQARGLALAATLEGRCLPPSPDFVSPAPVWVLDDFLPKQAHDQVLDFALSHDTALAPSTVGGINPHDNWRRSKVDLKPDVANFFVLPPVCEAALTAVQRFALEPFEFLSREVQFTAHNEGDFYKAHCDWGPGGMEHRRLTFVYYLHRQPRRFGGGGLRLFDSMEAANHYVDHAYTRIEPRDNRLVIFPSYVWHEVEGVTCPGGLYADGRFTFNGWIGIAKQE